MVIVVLSGGIGAQVFQFAAGYELSKKIIKERYENKVFL